MLARLVLAALVLGVVGMTAMAADDKPHPLLGQVKATVKDASKPFVMVITFKVKDGLGEKFEQAFAPAIAATLKEKGCRAYEMSRDPKSPNTYVLYEHWDCLNDLQAHLKAPHLKELGGKLGDLMDGPNQARILEPIGK